MRRHRAIWHISAAVGLLLIMFVRDAAPPAAYAVVNLGGLAQFDFDPSTGTIADIPPGLRQLDGRKVQVWGVAYAPLYSRASRTPVIPFQIVEGLHSSNFRPPRVQERIFASMPNVPFPPNFDFSSGLTFYGTLHVSARKDPMGFVEEIYTMDVDRMTTDHDVSVTAPPRPPKPWSPWRWATCVTGLVGVIGVSRLLSKHGRNAALRAAGVVPCPKCGYDMRATPWRCPECGHVPADSMAIG